MLSQAAGTRIKGRPLGGPGLAEPSVPSPGLKRTHGKGRSIELISDLGLQMVKESALLLKRKPGLLPLSLLGTYNLCLGCKVSHGKKLCRKVWVFASCLCRYLLASQKQPPLPPPFFFLF